MQRNSKVIVLNKKEHFYLKIPLATLLQTLHE